MHINNQITDNDIISAIESGSTSIRQQIQPILRDVRDITFDDVYQEACIILMENIKAGKLDGNRDTNLKGYLYRICERTALRYAGKKRPERMPAGDIKDKAEEPETKSPEEIEKEKEEEALKTRGFLDKVLDSIPPRCKAVLRYFYWDKMSMKEIATLLGLKNEDTAKSTKKRCMETFKTKARELLEDDELLEEAVRQTVERAALREQLDECDEIDSGYMARSEYLEGEAMLTDDDIIEGIKNNSPAAWRALFAKTR